MYLSLHDWNLPLKHPVILFGLLLLTVLIVPALFQRMKLPGIVGLILAGALFGPHGIGLLERGEGIQLLAQAGLLYLMFWAGLEINMGSFIRNRHKSLVFGLLTFALPLGVGWLCSYYLLGFEWMGALLMASMFSTHTLISYPIVHRLRISQNEAVAITVGGTVITDTLALLMLAVISGMAQGTLTGWFWLKLAISLAVFVFIISVLVPKAARWFFRKVESDLTYQYVFVLALVFVCGLLAELAGVEAIIGAFGAGLVLNRIIPHNSPLMDRVELVGNALFIPAFLFSVGMLVNLEVFFQGKEIIFMALLLTAVALLTKWMAAFATQKIFGYTLPQRNLIFGLSSSHAAATIAIILIGYQVKLFDEMVLNAIIFLILVTCLVSTIVSDKAAWKIATESHESLASQTRKLQRILVPFSNPDSVTRLVDFAFLIKTPGQHEPVYPLSIILDEKDARDKIRQSRQLMEPILQHAQERKVALSPIHRVDVSAVSGILRAAKELLATDIVIGWKPSLTATEKLFGTLHDNVLQESAEMLFVTHFIHSPFKFRELRIILPEKAHLERGFPGLVRRMETAAQNLGADIKLLAAPATAAAFAGIVSKKTNETLRIEPLSEESWWAFHEGLDGKVLPILVNARPGGISYDVFMDKLPGYLTLHFSGKNFVLAFPAL